jgi:GntP family gluconate:H+ symporter
MALLASPLLAFIVVLALIAVLTVRFRLNPFLTLFSSAIIYGLIAGIPPGEVVGTAARGAGAIFALLGPVVFAGSVIAGVIELGGYRERIFQDLNAVFPRSAYAGGIAGFLLAVPFMCCVTAFIVLSPLLSCCSDRKSALYAGAVGSALSFTLLFPTPVTLAIISSIDGFSAGAYLAVAVPLSAALMLAACRAIGGSSGGESGCAAGSAAGGRRAWLPLLIPLALAGAAVVWPVFGRESVSAFLIVGMAIALLFLPASLRDAALKKGTRHAGVIIYDLCGAGALGAVILASTFPEDAFGLLDGMVPAVFVPLLLAVLVQAAQGSRVVTAVVTAGMVAASGIAGAVGPVPLALMIAAGCLSVSAFSDPYFWVVRRETGDPVATVLMRFTLPLMAASALVAATAWAIAAVFT